MSARDILFVAVVVAASISAHGVVSLLDFEDAFESVVKVREDGAQGAATITNVCSTSGRHALWMGPSGGKAPAERFGFAEVLWNDRTKDDWSRFSRLTFDVTNLSRDERKLVLYLYDKGMKKSKDARFAFSVPSGITRRIEISLNRIGSGIDLRSMNGIAIVNSEVLFGCIVLDRFVLLDEDEKSLTATMQTAFGDDVRDALKAESALLDELDRELAEKDAIRLRELKASLAAEVAAQKRNLASFAKRIGLPDGSRMLVAQATGMDQIRPRQTDFSRLSPAEGIRIRLAKGEYEGAQIAVASAGEDAIRGVRVTAEGDAASRLRIEVAPVGYVFADAPTAHRQAYCEATQTNLCGYVRKTRETPLGWYADPILPFLGKVDVLPGDVQSFHVRIHAPEESAAGTFNGSLRVSAEGVDDVVVPLTVRVNGFKVGKISALPLLASFTPYVQPLSLSWTKAQADEVQRDPMAPVNLWRRKRLEWADFLFEYFIVPSTIYPSRGDKIPDFDLVLRGLEKGRVGYFTVGPWTKCSDEESWRKEYLEPLKKRVATARAAGLGDWIVTYGCDETEDEYFPAIRKALDILHKEVPNVPIVTTAVDPSLGTESPLGGIDWFVPLTSKWNPEMAVAARAQGRKVLWYVACGELPPLANMFVESPLSEGRLLMGAQALRMRPDGFLYYAVSKWNQRRPIETGPFTEWSPHGIRHRGKNAYDGDGVWAYCGPGGMPIATLRLENFRDGIEDYNCAKILERLLAAHKDKDDSWAVSAREAIHVPLSVMESMANFTDDPAPIRAWREKIDDLIEHVGEPRNRMDFAEGVFGTR